MEAGQGKSVLCSIVKGVPYIYQKGCVVYIKRVCRKHIYWHLPVCMGR